MYDFEVHVSYNFWKDECSGTEQEVEKVFKVEVQFQI